MDPITPYPPISRAPLRMRGIFGIAWQLYKRGFWQMFLVSLLLFSLPSVLLILPQFALYSRMGLWSDISENFSNFGRFHAFSADIGLQGIGTFLGLMGLLSLFSLAFGFLLMPMYRGALFLEMEERMEGRAGTLGQLFRYALPIGLKRFYTTFLSEYVVNMGIGIVLSILITIIAVIGALSSVFAFTPYLKTGILPASFYITLGIFIVLILLISVCLNVFLTLIYPVAAHEKKYAFSAVGRAFQLTVKRFWRILGATLLFTLISSVVSGVLCLPALLLWQNWEAMLALFVVLLSVASSLIMPYYAAFQTALYVDAAARVDGTEFCVIDPDSVPDPDPDELREGPRTL